LGFSSPRFVQAGFTLLEILVVVVIIAITAALALPALSVSPQEQLRAETARVAALLEAARDEAVFGGRAIAVVAADGRIGFAERDRTDARNWRAIAEGPLRERTLAEGFVASIARAADGESRLVFLPAGVARPLAIDVAGPAGTKRIGVDALGNVTIADAPAR
jgi:general secretion pathway protein H